MNKTLEKFKNINKGGKKTIEIMNDQQLLENENTIEVTDDFLEDKSVINTMDEFVEIDNQVQETFKGLTSANSGVILYLVETQDRHDDRYHILQWYKKKLPILGSKEPVIKARIIKNLKKIIKNNGLRTSIKNFEALKKEGLLKKYWYDFENSFKGIIQKIHRVYNKYIIFETIDSVVKGKKNQIVFYPATNTTWVFDTFEEALFAEMVGTDNAKAMHILFKGFNDGR